MNGEDWVSPGPVQRAWASDPGVLAVNDTRVGAARLGAESVSLFSYTPVGPSLLPVVTLSGRMPAAPDEIALAPRSADGKGAKIGDVVTLKTETELRLRVTGIAFVPESPHNGYAEGGWLTGGGYERLFPDGSFKFHQTMIALRPGMDVAAVTERLTAAVNRTAGGPVMSLDEPIVPAQVEQIRNVRILPLALGVFLALLAVGATGHALASAIRRRAHDIAVLRALGVTRGQTRLIVVTQASTLAVFGIAFGVPLGVALGRTLWRVVADITPLLYVPRLDGLALALIAPAALAVVNVLAALPARRAVRMRVGEVLRAE